MADPMMEPDMIHLQPNSPCINAGIDPRAYISELTNDFFGTRRPYPAGGRYDIGAVEATNILLNTAPAISVIEPDGINDKAGKTYTITWRDSDPDNDAQISLYYDTDSTGYDGTLIADGLSEDADSTNGSYTWNISAVPRGSYYIYARIDDGVNFPVYSYSPGPLTIQNMISLIYPLNNTSVHNISPTFKWEIPGEENNKTLHFQVQIADDEAFTHVLHAFESKNDTLGFSPIPPVQQAKGNQYYTILKKLGYDKTYYWRIRGWNGTEYYIDSEIWRFETRR
ncbi:MAG: Ser-Thr-rich GPI-anchored membrane family protein [bacterium]|nr:Ser-Thr-rich GPI-anchored membrane family protein [bacterium]